jgi:hypothetical protein
MRERQAVAEPARDRNDLSRHEAEEHDGHHDEHGDEGRGARLACERSEQGAERPERRAGDEEAGRKEWQTLPRLAAGDATGLDAASNANKVDFPAPFGPISASASPAFTSTSVGSSATCVPKRRATLRARSTVSLNDSPRCPPGEPPGSPEPPPPAR